MKLIMNAMYAVETEYEQYIGTYRGPTNHKYFPPFKNTLWDVKVKIKSNQSTKMTKSNKSTILVQFVSINANDIVYDLDKIKKLAKDARDSFEKRAVNKILKALVNEHFEW